MSEKIYDREVCENSNTDKLLMSDTNVEVTAQKEDKREGSTKTWVTVLSLWNTMIGSNIVSLPWSFSLAGIIPSIIINVIYFYISYYTCLLVVKYGLKDNDFSLTLENSFQNKTFGKVMKYLQITLCTIYNLGGIYIYLLIVNASQNLFPIISLILNSYFDLGIDANDTTPYLNRFSLMYCCLGVIVLVFPFTLLRNIGIFIKMSSFGVYFIVILIFYLFYIGFKALMFTSYEFGYKKNNGTSPSYLYLFGTDISQLAGNVSLGLLTHVIILPILNNNEKSQNNTIVLKKAYIITFFTYISVGLLGYIAFTGSDFYSFFQDPNKNFQDNWTNFFPASNKLILVFRLFQVAQCLSTLPIIFYVTRLQVLSAVFGNKYPSFVHVLVFNLFIILFGLIVIYFFYNKLGQFMAIVGAGSGFVLIYVTPLLVDLFRQSKSNISTKNLLHINVSSDKKIVGNGEKIEKSFSIGLKILLIIIGLFTLIIQFEKINFFNVEITI